MANITLFDGTRDPKYGTVLGIVLRKIAPYTGNILCTPEPGSRDVQGYNLVKHFEKCALDARRQQVDEGLMIGMLHNLRLIREDPATKVILTERDLFAEGCNWIFGGYVPFEGMEYVVLSIARMQHAMQFQDLIAHELGHRYGAAPAGRTNTEENLGSHCLNDFCVMQQHLTVSSAVDYSIQRHKAGAPLFCSQCAADLRVHA